MPSHLEGCFREGTAALMWTPAFTKRVLLRDIRRQHTSRIFYLLTLFQCYLYVPGSACAPRVTVIACCTHTCHTFSTVLKGNPADPVQCIHTHRPYFCLLHGPMDAAKSLKLRFRVGRPGFCLLYTSDAADE